MCTSTNDNEVLYKVSSLYDQPSQRRSEHKLFHTLHPTWIHHNSKKNDWILLSWQCAHLLNDNEVLYKVSSLYDQPSQRRSEHKLFHTLHPTWIHHNSKKNYWTLLSWQYAHLLMIMKHCTKFQVSVINRLGEEMSTIFCDRQTDRQKVQYQYVSPRRGGDIISLTQHWHT
jgi:hypothetical protein